MATDRRDRSAEREGRTCNKCGAPLPSSMHLNARKCRACSRAPIASDTPPNLRRDRRCEECSGPIPRKRRTNAKYCSDACRLRVKSRRVYRRRKNRRRHGNETGAGTPISPETARARATDILVATPPGDRAELKRELLQRGLFDRWRDGDLRHIDLARMLDVSQSQIKRACDELVVEWNDALERDGWEMNPEHASMLGRDLHQPDRGDPEACSAWATEMANRFLAFEAEFFRLPSNKPWLRKPFHRRWIVEALLAYATGGYTQILAPPRHGKSALLTHFCVWLVCRNPAVRILWVGPSGDIAEDFVWTVAEILGDNQELVDATLPPGLTYAPPKRGAGSNWTRQQFTVKCRPYGITGATMVAAGRGGKLLSRNCDIIVCDDIEDVKATEEPGQRKKTRRWFSVTLDSRKEEHTALFVIGSRQHHDDLYGYNLEDPNFRCVVEAAHDPDCRLDADDHDAHTDCVLFPEIRSYRWLRSKETGATARIGEEGEEGDYEMVYLNDTTKSAASYYTEANTQPALNRMRGLGLDGVPAKGRRLVAGLDPATSGYQAAFLWAVTPVEGATEEVVLDNLTRLRVQDMRMKRWMVDLENRRSGGIEAAMEQMETWRVAYGVTHWVIEDMLFQKGFTDDPRVKLWARTHGVHLESHTTSTNKYDARWGLGAMVRLFDDDLIDLPYSDEQARTKTELLRRQMYRFDGNVDSERKRRKDVHMAAWFPHKAIRRFEKELVADKSRHVTHTNSDYPVSYPDLAGFTGGMNQAPWSR